MHELSLAASVFELIERECHRLGKWNVSEVEIEIGELSAIEKESFKFCLDNIKRETAFRNVIFTFVNVEAQAVCIACSNKFHTSVRFPECPQCHSSQVSIIQGNEFKVKSLIFT